MRTARRLAAGTLSLGALCILLVGVPYALAAVVGWPLPHSWPSMTQVRNVLETSGISDTLLVDSLALVCWIAWLDFALATVVELASAVAGRPARRVPVLRAWQPVVARLITTIVVAWSAVGTRPAPSGPAQPATLTVAIAGRHASSALGVHMAEGLAQPIAAAAPQPTPAAGDEYVVHRGDTLWDIAQHRLGDPRRWPEVWRRNEDRAEPGGRRFTDPNLIVPGWRLEVERRAASTPASTHGTAGRSPSNGADNGSAPPASGAAPMSPPPATPAPVASPTPAAPAAAPSAATTPAPATERSHAADQRPGEGIPLPQGGFVGMGFAAGVVTGLAAARWHERRRRRVGSVPRPTVEALVTPAVRHLQRTVDDASRREEADGPAVETGERREPAAVGHAVGRVPLGVRTDPGGASVEVDVDVTALSGFALTGDGAAGVTRALIAAVASADWREQAEVLTVGRASELLASVREVPGAEYLVDAAAAIHRVQGECAGRERALECAEVDDYHALADSLAPLGTLLVVVDAEALAEGDGARLATFVGRARRLGVSLIAVGWAPGFELVDVGDDGTVIAAPPPLRAIVDRFFTLPEPEAREALAVLSAGRGGPVQVTEHENPPPPVVELVTPGDLAEGHGDETRPVLIRLFGPPRIEVNGVEVRTGLREKARELLALLVLRRSGLRLDEALTVMWSDDDERHRDTLHVSATATRALFRRLTGNRDGRFIAHSAQRYVLEPELVDADAWALERSLAEAGRGPDVDARREALARIELVVAGPPLDGADYEWAEPAREHLRRQAVDALAELAQLRSEAGDVDGALSALERARSVDPPCEDVHRRLMRQLADAGREEIALRVYDEVECHAAQLGTTPEEETEDLMVQIRGRVAAGRRRSRAVAADSQSFAARQNGAPPHSSSRQPSRAQGMLPILDDEEIPPA